MLKKLQKTKKSKQLAEWQTLKFHMTSTSQENNAIIYMLCSLASNKFQLWLTHCFPDSAYDAAFCHPEK